MLGTTRGYRVKLESEKWIFHPQKNSLGGGFKYSLPRKLGKIQDEPHFDNHNISVGLGW